MRKTIKERIRERILLLRESGALKPGALVPSFHELRREFDTSYATVQGAVESLERDGIVQRRQGFGTVMSGLKPLTIELFLTANSFPAQEIETLLGEFCKSFNLYLDVKLRNRNDFPDGGRALSGKKAIIYEAKFFDRPALGSLLDYSSFSDHDEIMGQLKELPLPNRNIFLPFSLFPVQMAVNLRLLKQIGLDDTHLDSGLSWWDDCVERCKRHGVHPAIKRWRLHSLWLFEKFLPLLFGLRLNEAKERDVIHALPLFDTECGRRFLRIMKSISTFSQPLMKEPPSFEGGQAAVSFNAGSWLAVQHERRFGLPAEDFKIVPYMMDGRKICNCEMSGLMTFISPDVLPDERRRIWEFVKMLVSREFQLRLAELSGMVSVRKDIAPSEHPWNNRPDYAAFFPGPSDLDIYNNVFNMQVIAALSSLYEQFEFHGAGQGCILKDMDEKVRSIHEPT